jgi:hypothetical protein
MVRFVYIQNEDGRLRKGLQANQIKGFDIEETQPSWDSKNQENYNATITFEDMNGRIYQEKYTTRLALDTRLEYLREILRSSTTKTYV